MFDKCLLISISSPLPVSPPLVSPFSLVSPFPPSLLSPSPFPLVSLLSVYPSQPPFPTVFRGAPPPVSPPPVSRPFIRLSLTATLPHGFPWGSPSPVSGSSPYTIPSALFALSSSRCLFARPFSPPFILRVTLLTSSLSA